MGGDVSFAGLDGGRFGVLRAGRGCGIRAVEVEVEVEVVMRGG